MAIHVSCDFCGEAFNYNDDYENISVTFVRYGSRGEGLLKNRHACTTCGKQIEEFLQEMTGHDDCGGPIFPKDRKWKKTSGQDDQ